MDAPEPFDYVAYRLANQGYGIGHGEARRQLQERFPGRSDDEVITMYNRARLLYETAYDLCGQVYDKK